MRLVRSELPPAGKGTMMRSGLDGNVCACAAPAATPSAMAAAADTVSMRVTFMPPPVAVSRLPFTLYFAASSDKGLGFDGHWRKAVDTGDHRGPRRYAVAVRTDAAARRTPHARLAD